MKCVALVVCAIACGCAEVTPRIPTPHVQDAHAPADFYEANLHRESPPCDRAIALFPAAGAASGRRYKEIASLSATCSPGSLELCEQRLKERACELKADAVIMTESTPGASPAGASGQSLVSKSGRAIRWVD
jgi:hypothetical protein